MRKIEVKKIFFMSLALVLLLFTKLEAETVSPRLSVSPPLFELKVKRGEEFLKKIKILNQSGVPVPIEATVTNFGAEENSGTMTFFEEPAKRVGQEDDISFNPRKWIQIQNPNFILDSRETEGVDLSIKVPENAEPGGHYAVILFEPKLPSYYFEPGTPLKAIPKIGVLILFSVEVEGLERTGKPLTIAEFNIPENFHLKKLESFIGFFSEALAFEKENFTIVEKSKLPFTLSLKNEDIYHIKPEGKLAISKENGKLVGKIEIKEITILPGKTRKFPVEFEPNLPKILEKYLPAWASSFISQNILFGKYKALLNLKVDDDIINKEIEFWVFPWKIFFPLFFVVSILLILLIKYRKRIKSAFLVLFRKS